MASEALREAFRFHLEHGGYCTPPGRAACALRAARDEIRAQEEGVVFTWDYDPDPDTSWMDERAQRQYETGTLEMLGCIATLGEHEASLWGVSVLGWGDSYRRVVEADLASEVLRAYDQAQAEEAGLHRDPVTI